MDAPNAPSRVRQAMLRAADWIACDPKRKRRLEIAAALVAFQGTALVLVGNKLVANHPAVFFVGLLMILAGAFVLLAGDIRRALRPAEAPVSKAASPAETQEETPTLADRLLGRLTAGGRHNWAFSVAGIGVLAFDLLFNVYLTPSPDYNSTDFVIMGLGITLIAFPFFPVRLRRERNFATLFFSALSLIFGVPLILLRLGDDPYLNTDEYTAALVAPQLGWLVNFFGPTALVNGNEISYVTKAGDYLPVFIATQCSGLYSMGIFMAAFSALVLTEYARLTWRVGVLLAAGILFAYFANLLRMFIIVEVGYFYGGPSLLWVHTNLGDLIFLLWVTPFVWLSYRVLDPARAPAQIDADRFAQALREQGIDPATVTEDDWFCASCFRKIDVFADADAPAACPSCGASLA